MRKTRNLRTTLNRYAGMNSKDSASRVTKFRFAKSLLQREPMQSEPMQSEEVGQAAAYAKNTQSLFDCREVLPHVSVQVDHARLAAVDDIEPL